MSISTGSKLSAGQFLDNYEIIKLIGKGGMAEVYEASQPHMNRRVAIKVMISEQSSSQDFAARFAREKQALTLLEHPHILPIFDSGSSQGLNYIVMRLVEGGSLEKLIMEQGAIPLADVRYYLERIGSALDFAHTNEIIHRDLKPSNILFDRVYNPYITDFGIAKLLFQEQARISASGALLGTPAYMSPEQLTSKPLDCRSDIFALGIIVFEMLTGELPFDIDTPIAVVHKYVYEDLPIEERLTPQFGEQIASIVQKAVAREPQRRYQSAGEFAREFLDATLDVPKFVTPNDTLPVRPGEMDAQLNALHLNDNPVSPRKVIKETDDETIVFPDELNGEVSPAVKPQPIPPIAVSKPLIRHIQQPIPIAVQHAIPDARESKRNISSDSVPGKPIANRFAYEAQLMPNLPHVCPICLREANTPIKVRVRTSGWRSVITYQNRPILFCAQHAIDYRTLSPAYIAAHVGLTLIAGVSIVLTGWLGLLIFGGLIVFFYDNMKRLQSDVWRRAHKAVRIRAGAGNKIEYAFQQPKYAEAFYQANASKGR